MQATKTEALNKWLKDYLRSPTDPSGGLGGPGPQPGNPPAPPPFAAANYIFSIDSIEIMNTRSRREDSNKASVAVAVGSGQPLSAMKDLGNQNNGHFPVNLSVGPINVATPDVGIAFNYLVLNAGHSSVADIESKLTTTGTGLAIAGAAAATAAIGATAVGAAIGTTVLPVIGTAIVALGTWLVTNLISVLFADCDGPVAAEQVALKGGELWTRTAHGSYSHITYHPGLDSSGGCGSNSKYNIYWTIKRA
jgi:hypothetical protein